MKTFREFLHEQEYMNEANKKIVYKGYDLEELFDEIYNVCKGMISNTKYGKLLDKNKVTQKDIDELKDKMEIYREIADKKGDKKAEKELLWYPSTAEHYLNSEHIDKDFDYYVYSLESEMKLQNSVKIGDDEDKAFKKIDDIIKKINRGKYDLYERLSKEEFEEQIEEFNGNVKYDGPLDFYVKIKDGKVVSKGF